MFLSKYHTLTLYNWSLAYFEMKSTEKPSLRKGGTVKRSDNAKRFTQMNKYGFFTSKLEMEAG